MRQWTVTNTFSYHNQILWVLHNGWVKCDIGISFCIQYYRNIYSSFRWVGNQTKYFVRIISHTFSLLNLKVKQRILIRAIDIASDNQDPINLNTIAHYVFYPCFYFLKLQWEPCTQELTERIRYMKQYRMVRLLTAPNAFQISERLY